jgi:hypothetical protein
MAISKKTANIGKGKEQLEPLYITSVVTLENWQFLKKCLANPLLHIYPKTIENMFPP